MINLGAIFFDRGDTDRALELNQQALAISPDMAEAHVNIGLIHQHRNEVDQAIECYSKAVQIDPKLITAWINLTSAYTMLEEDEKAVDAARQAVTLEPDSPMARNNLAVALYFKGDFKEAQRNMEKAQELGYSVDPRFVEALQAKLGVRIMSSKAEAASQTLVPVLRHGCRPADRGRPAQDARISHGHLRMRGGVCQRYHRP